MFTQPKIEVRPSFPVAIARYVRKAGFLNRLFDLVIGPFFQVKTFRLVRKVLRYIVRSSELVRRSQEVLSPGFEQAICMTKVGFDIFKMQVFDQLITKREIDRPFFNVT